MARDTAREDAAFDRRRPFYVDIEIPVGGLERRLDEINMWLDDSRLEVRGGPGGPRHLRLSFSEYETAAACAKSFGFDV